MESKTRLIVFTLVMVFLISGLNTSFTIGKETEDSPGKNEGKIVILPFFKGRYEANINEIMDKPVANISYDIKKVSPEAGSILTGVVHEEMNSKYGNKIAPLLDGIIVYDRIKKGNEDTIRNLAKKAGELLKVNRVVVGYVWSYKRRVGSSMAASSPASVGFTICLIDVSNGETLWKGSYEESQKSLSDDILKIKGFFERGAKWLMVEDLARYGVKEVIKKFPY